MVYNRIDEIFYEINTELPRKPSYDNYITSSTYLPMRDGVKIAVDINLPENLPLGEKISTILVQTCYWRVKKLRKGFKWLKNLLILLDFQKEFTSYGFAIVNADVRGTGASFGTRPYPWSEEEIKDNKDIVDWIISQPWSDGYVVTWGHSYLGTTAELVGVVNHPNVKGLVPMHNEFDPYLDIAFPGGIMHKTFINDWSFYINRLDQNTTKGLGLLARLFLKGVKPVESDKDKNFLKEAVYQHSLNTNVAEMAPHITFRDDNWNDSGSTLKNFSVYRYKEEIEKLNVPIFCWGSWMDAGTANAIIERFLTFQNPQIGVIGAWTHAALWHASPYLPPKKREPEPPFKIQVQEWIRFYDACLKGEGISKNMIIYYTMGEEKWKKTSKWPPSYQTMQRWYFKKNNILSKLMPQENSGADDYEVNFKASTGKKNRWATQMGGGPVIYKNMVKEDKKLLTYDSDPLEEDIEITGYPIVILFLTSTHKDGAIFVYLEDVDEFGNVIYITEGLLRVIHRKISDETPPYNILVPYHSYKKKDALPLIPGEIAEIKFGLLPTSTLIRKRHRIRIAIAGADKETFARYPKEGNPTITIARNKNHASFIDLPIILKKKA